MTDTTTLSSPSELASFVKDEFPYEDEHVQTITENTHAALVEAYQRFGDQHGVFLQQAEDGTVLCSLGRVDPETGTASCIFEALVRTGDTITYDLRESGQVMTQREPTMQQGEVNHPETFTTLRLPSGVDVESDTGFAVVTPTNVWQGEADEGDYTLPTELRGSVFTSNYYRRTDHHVYLDDGDELRLAVDKNYAGLLQKHSTDPTPSVQDAYVEDGTQFVYYPYIVEFESETMTLEPKNIDPDDIDQDVDVTERIDMTGALGFIIGGALIPPKRCEQNTVTAGEVEVRQMKAVAEE